MIEGMMPDTVIVDMAAETGGNCELTRPGESYMHGDTLIVGPVNLPSSGAVHASEMFSRNVYNMLRLMLDERGQLHLDWGDEILSTCLLTHNGNIHHQATADLMKIDCAAPITEQRERTEEPGFSDTGDSSFDEDEERDDLMQLDGIGPALQNRLYAFDIRTYKKLASLDELEIERLERQLDDNEGLRVSDWVRQAQELEKPL